MPTNEQQRRAITYLVKTGRESIPRAPHLDEPGIMAALAKVHALDVFTVAMAGMRLAADPSIKTPGMLADPTSSVYRERLGQPAARRHPTPASACDVCGREMHAADFVCDTPRARGRRTE